MKITPEMIEAGARGLFEHYKGARPTAYGPNRALSPEQRRRDWEGVAIKSWFRRKAEAVLRAALEADDAR